MMLVDLLVGGLVGIVLANNKFNFTKDKVLNENLVLFMLFKNNMKIKMNLV